MITLIAAVSANMVLADQHGIPWAGTMSSDVAFFREQTIDGVVVMGRTVYEEAEAPLERRENLVITHLDSVREGFVKTTIDDVLELAQTQDVWIIGGGSIYAQFMPSADRIVLNRLGMVVAGTVLFPDISSRDWQLDSRSKPVQGPEDAAEFYTDTYLKRKV